MALSALVRQTALDPHILDHCVVNILLVDPWADRQMVSHCQSWRLVAEVALSRLGDCHRLFWVELIRSYPYLPFLALSCSPLNSRSFSLRRESQETDYPKQPPEVTLGGYEVPFVGSLQC